MSARAAKADVLVVDDEPDVAKIISINLEMEGYDARVAYNGRQALDEIALKKPDCILLDIMMPEMDGWEVLRILKDDSNTADIPVVVVTARSTDVDQIKGFSGGAVEYIIKPFDPRQLLDYVERALKPGVEELEEEIRQDRIRRLQLSTIYDITEALISTLEIDEVLEIVAKRLLILFGLDLCAVCLLEPSGRSLRLASSRSTTPLSDDDLDLLSMPLQDLMDILRADPADLSGPQYVPMASFTFIDESSKLSRLQSIYILPMRAKGKFTGVIYLGKKDNMKLSEDELELLSANANEAAMTIENTRLYDDLR
jgi:CheY-like chemotaxis protein